MNGLFISYRRDDSAPYAGRLYDFLRNRLPQQRVFMDIDAIEPGEDFVVAINRTLGSSRVVLAIIGPDWLDAKERDGSRRLDNPDDYVVRELQAALQSQARVIPVLVGDAAMPRTDSLPEVLRPLARRNAIEISDMRFNYDADRLAGAIERVAAAAAEAQAGQPAAAQAQAAHAPEQARPMPASAPQPAAAGTVADGNPPQLQTLKRLVWTAFAIDLLVALFTIARHGHELETYVVGTVLLGGLAIGVNVMMLRGRRWARMAYAVLYGLSVASLFDSSFVNIESAFNLVSLGLGARALWLLFTPPLKHRYAAGAAATATREA